MGDAAPPGQAATLISALQYKRALQQKLPRFYSRPKDIMHSLLSSPAKTGYFRHGAIVGGGIAWKLSDKVNIGIEQRFTFLIDGDDLDGLNVGRSADVLIIRAVESTSIYSEEEYLLINLYGGSIHTTSSIMS